MSNLYNEIFKLKQELRKGWIEEGQRCILEKDRLESDAEHIFFLLYFSTRNYGKRKFKPR